MNARDISVVVTTFQEAGNIARCLESVRGFGEIIVVDSFSADATTEIAGRHASMIYQRAYRSPSEQKNWAVARARNPWVLVLDADEALTPGLRREIETLDPGGNAGFWIHRTSQYLGHSIRGCGWQRDKVLRLYDRRRASYPEALVHEEVRADGPVGRLAARLAHTPYRDVAQHLDKIDGYTSRGARQYLARGGRVPLFQMLTHPPLRFFRMYVLQAGFRDGYPGLVLCLLSSFSVLLKYAKAWELRRSA